MRLEHKRQSGFTLIELTLSIAFLGTLLLMSSAIIVQSISIYNKGVALKQINQAGRSLVEDINRVSAGGFQVMLSDNGTAGYLCIKDTNIWRSYTWNSVRQGVGGTTTVGPKQFTYDGQAVSLARSNDTVNGSSNCNLPTGSDLALNTSQVTPMLTSQVRILSVDITSPDSTDATLAGLRKVAFWFGTYDESGAVQGMSPVFDGATHTWMCQGGKLGDFCAVSKFETVLYTANQETTIGLSPAIRSLLVAGETKASLFRQTGLDYFANSQTAVLSRGITRGDSER